MKPKSLITAFEYQRLIIDGVNFREEHLSILDRWACSQNIQYLEIGRRSIRFSQYVGVIQIKDLVIEVLPKIDRSGNNSESREKWREALLGMLQVAGIVQSRSSGPASLRTTSSSFLDMLYEEFLTCVERIVGRGFKKGYIRTKSNLGLIRGKILFNRNIRENYIHKERNFCEFTSYSPDIPINQVLKQAVKIVSQSARLPGITDQASRLLLYFENISDCHNNSDDFKRIFLSRESADYQQGFDIARLIITGYAPTLSSGDDSVVSILFDMNELFEAFVLKHLKRAENEIKGLSVKGQVSKPFWSHRNIRPDILIDFNGRRIIADTKWKVPKNSKPSDPDLKQMFAYNRVFDCRTSLLIYPQADPAQEQLTGQYAEGSGTCTMSYLPLFDENQMLNHDYSPFIHHMIKLNHPNISEMK